MDVIGFILTALGTVISVISCIIAIKEAKKAMDARKAVDAYRREEKIASGKRVMQEIMDDLLKLCKRNEKQFRGRDRNAVIEKIISNIHRAHDAMSYIDDVSMRDSMKGLLNDITRLNTEENRDKQYEVVGKMLVEIPGLKAKLNDF